MHTYFKEITLLRGKGQPFKHQFLTQMVTELYGSLVTPSCGQMPSTSKIDKRQNSMVNCTVQMTFQFTGLEFPFPDLLRSEGENHPTDDKIEQENRIDGKGFAVWRLTVSKESCRGYYRPGKHHDHHKKPDHEVYRSRISQKHQPANQHCHCQGKYTVTQHTEALKKRYVSSKKF